VAALHAEPDLRELTSVCVHCGFCLPSCPTYVLWGEEMDSPRGRIHLLTQLLDGAATSSAVQPHLDACLGCLACVPACPSGVRYDAIVSDGRVLIEHGAPRGFRDRLRRELIFALFPYPRRLRALRGPLRVARWLGIEDAAVVRRLDPTLAAAAALAPPLRPRVRLPERVRARPGGRLGARRAVVGLLTGCVQSAYFSNVSAATARVLALEGCDVIVPRWQGCCGALSLHVGRDKQARRLARRTIAAFTKAGVDTIVTDVAGCGSAMKDYARLLADDPEWAGRAEALAGRVRDVTEVLADLEPLTPRTPLPLTVAYHDACHLANGQGVRKQPRDLLRGIPELKLVEITGGAACCGSAGVYNLLQPEAAADLGRRRAAAVIATGADVVAAGNVGCLLQLASVFRADEDSRAPAVRHTVELLDASLRGAPTHGRSR
jgi:glycolate oxidase iron-sulfur subunit